MEEVRSHDLKIKVKAFTLEGTAMNDELLCNLLEGFLNKFIKENGIKRDDIININLSPIQTEPRVDLYAYTPISYKLTLIYEDKEV